MRVFIILFFIYFIIINSNNHLFSNAITEAECLGNLVIKYDFDFPVINGNYNICDVVSQQCDSAGSLLTINFKNPNSSNEDILIVNDISCLPNIKNIYLGNFLMEYQFLTYKFPNALSINYQNVTFTTNNINEEIPQYNSVTINSKSFEDSVLNLSYIKNIVTTFSLYNKVRLIEPVEDNSNLELLSLQLYSFVDLSKFKKLRVINFEFVDGFDYSTFSLISTFKASNNVQINSFSANAPIPLSIFSITNYITPTLILNGQFETPSSPMDILLPSNTTISLNSFSSNFLLDGLLPFKVSNSSVVVSSFLQSLQPLSQYSSFNKISFTSATFYNSSLGTYQGDFEYFVLSSSKITGVNIDSSWCSTNLAVPYNLLSGIIPSCFKCYFQDLEIDNKYPNLPTMKNRFIGNSFSNFDTTESCTTFAPKPQIIDNSSLLVNGTDIGYKPYNYFIDNIECSSYTVNEIGKSYICNDLNGLFNGKDYYSIRFLHPNNQTLTFPASSNSRPSIASVVVTESSLVINGKFFSSYSGYVVQTVKIQNLDCNIDNSASDFFKLSCSFSSSSNLLDISDLVPLEVNVNSLVSKVLVSKTKTNDKQCSNDCQSIKNSLCDLSSGLCSCLSIDGTYQDCNTHTISSVDASNESGGEATFYGDFTNEHNGLSIKIGDQPCFPITLNTSSIIKCIALAGKGIKSVTMVQNGLTFIGANIYKYKETLAVCPNNCTNINQGICNSATGICNCINGYQTFDCSIKQSENGGGQTDIGTGSTNITNGDTKFQIYFNVLNEIDIQGNLINSYKLKDNWITNSTQDSIYTFKQQLNGTDCIVTSTIEEITNEDGKDFIFANTTFNLSKNSIKFTISIENYSYQSSLNTLSLEFMSTVDQLASQSTCNTKDIEIDTSNVNDISSFNYIKISKNNQILTGRFINKLISDSRPTFYSTTIKNNTTTQNSSIVLTLNLPHCKQCIIDPDFSVVLSNSFKNDCSSSSSRSWVIPVSVVVSVVGFALVIIIGAIVYKKNTSLKILIGVKLKRLNQ